MKLLTVCCIIALAFSTNTTYGQEKKEGGAAQTSEQVAVMKTSEGEMVFKFWTDAAPKTIENFKKLATSGFYNGTSFHRIVNGFMVQGGDPLTKDVANEARFGTGDPGYSIKAEFNDHKHVRGVLSMARSNDPDSAGSQFFICLAPKPSLDHQYTTFGKLVKGDDVLEKIARTPVVVGESGEKSKPTKRVTIEKIEIVPADSVK